MPRLTPLLAIALIGVIAGAGLATYYLTHQPGSEVVPTPSTWSPGEASATTQSPSGPETSPPVIVPGASTTPSCNASWAREGFMILEPHGVLYIERVSGDTAYGGFLDIETLTDYLIREGVLSGSDFASGAAYEKMLSYLRDGGLGEVMSSIRFEGVAIKLGEYTASASPAIQPPLMRRVWEGGTCEDAVDAALKQGGWRFYLGPILTRPEYLGSGVFRPGNVGDWPLSGEVFSVYRVYTLKDNYLTEVRLYVDPDTDIIVGYSAVSARGEEHVALIIGYAEIGEVGGGLPTTGSESLSILPDTAIYVGENITHLYLHVRNTGTAPANIFKVEIAGVEAVIIDKTVEPGGELEMSIPLTKTYEIGYRYNMRIYTRGGIYTFIVTAQPAS